MYVITMCVFVFNVVVPFHGSVITGNHELLVISIVSLGVAVVVCMVLAITMTSIACICRKGRRPVISGRAIAMEL